MIHDLRIRRVNDAPLRADGDLVLYWMVAARRANRNHALERAVEHARELDKPLLVLEALRCGYPHASDRLHRFVLDGMRDNARAFAKSDALYHPYVETEEGAGQGLLAALAEKACVVVTDDFPAFFLPRMVAAAGAKLRVRLEAVDSNGILPIRAPDKVFSAAYHFRRFLQNELQPHLADGPKVNPLARISLRRLRSLPGDVAQRWPAAPAELLEGGAGVLADLPIDHDVPPVDLRGGSMAGARALRRFLDQRLERYGEDRNQPDEEATSGLSPYLHFGHVSAHQVLDGIARREDWSPDDVQEDGDGSREGWWGLGESAEAFLDQLVTWRELGLNMCANRRDHDRWSSLPDWARTTLDQHAGDPREHTYGPKAFERAGTHDEVWNAAQRQLLREGRIHNYLRMLWGKKILEWSSSPRRALGTMIELNDRHALDGRDPNSYSGICWCLGRYDRPWAPERPIFGRVRYMSSKNTVRKLRLKGYLERYGAVPAD